MECPKYPLYSDSVTQVLKYEDLFAIHEAEKISAEEKAKAVQSEKNFQKMGGIKLEKNEKS